MEENWSRCNVRKCDTNGKSDRGAPGNGSVTVRWANLDNVKVVKDGFPKCLRHQSKHLVAKSTFTTTTTTFPSTDVVFVIFKMCHQNSCCCFMDLALLASVCDSYQKLLILHLFLFFPGWIAMTASWYFPWACDVLHFSVSGVHCCYSH